MEHCTSRLQIDNLVIISHKNGSKIIRFQTIIRVVRSHIARESHINRFVINSMLMGILLSQRFNMLIDEQLGPTPNSCRAVEFREHIAEHCFIYLNTYCTHNRSILRGQRYEKFLELIAFCLDF